MLDALLSHFQRFAARRMFSKWAKDYEEDVTDNFYSAADAVASAVFAHLKDAPNPFIADIGIGTGLLTEKIAAAMPCRIKGIDSSEEMLALCRTKNADWDLVHADAGRTWPLFPDAYDAVLAAGLAEYLTPSMLHNFILQSAAALKTNGLLIFTYIPAKRKKIVYWGGKTGGYLCCMQDPHALQHKLIGMGFDILDHGPPFDGCIYHDGSSYEYRMIAAQKRSPNAR